MRVALDAEGEPLRLAVEAGPEIVKVNAAEAAGLLGRPADGREDALAACAQLRELAGGDGHAGIVTRGADGRHGRPLPTAPGTRACCTSEAGTRSAAATRSSRVWSSGSSAAIPGRTRSGSPSARPPRTPSSPARARSTPRGPTSLAARAEIREL